MRRRLLNKMQTEQDERNRSAAVKAQLVPTVILTMVNNNPDDLRLTLNDSAVFQGAAPSSPAGSVPPAQPAPIKRKPGRPRKQ